MAVSEVKTRKVECERCPLRKQPAFREFTEPELGFITKFKIGEQTIEAGGTILSEGTASPHLYTVLKGWAFRYKLLPDGRRQILNFALPGDFLGMQAEMFDAMDHSVEALNNVHLCVFSRERVHDLYEAHPDLAYDMTWIACREERLLDEHLLSVGRRTALERVAYVLLKLCDRAEDAGLCEDGVFAYPFTQNHLADALGLSQVHTNRTIRRLTAMGHILWRDRMFTLRDRDAMVEIAGIEDAERGLRPLI